MCKWTVSVEEIVARRKPRSLTPHLQGVWRAGLNARLRGESTDPFVCASKATVDAWHSGWNAADDYLKQHYLVICGSCGQPIASACKGVIS